MEERMQEQDRLDELLSQLRRAEPEPDLAGRIVAAVEAQAAAAETRQRRWRTTAIGLGVAFAALLFLALGYDTLVVLNQGGALAFLSLFWSQPDVVVSYPVEALLALVESLPLVELALTLGALLVGALLVEQLAAVLRGVSRVPRNGFA